MASGEMSDEAFTAFLAKVWTGIESALVPGGIAYLCMDWRHVSNTLHAMGQTSLELLNLIVWDKKAGGMGSFYRSRHELVFLAKKPGDEHKNRVQLGSNGRDRCNVWTYDGVNGFGAAKAKARDLHPTVKPMAMVRDALFDSSDRGDVVFDLFCGSGTTLIAAEVSKRKGRAIELDPVYADTGVVRWQDFTGREAVLIETGETFAQVRARRAQERASMTVEGGAPVASPCNQTHIDEEAVQ
jgi:DNA modification methylase